MGHLINPLAYRLGTRKSLNLLLPKNKINSFFVEDIDLYFRLAFMEESVVKTDIKYSHFKLLWTLQKVAVDVFLYIPDFVIMQKKRFLKYIMYLLPFVDKRKSNNTKLNAVDFLLPRVSILKPISKQLLLRPFTKLSYRHYLKSLKKANLFKKLFLTKFTYSVMHATRTQKKMKSILNRIGKVLPVFRPYKKKSFGISPFAMKKRPEVTFSFTSQSKATAKRRGKNNNLRSFLNATDGKKKRKE